MSIYIDPEEYYCSPEPEKQTGKTDEVSTGVETKFDSLKVLDWEHLYQEVDETDNDDLPLGGYKYLGSIYTHGEYLDE